MEMIKKLHDLLKDKKLSLSVAESCTGGLISHYITSLPGASVFFLAGIVAYSEEIKKNVLGVSDSTIQAQGVVSRETALEMAEKVRFITKSDCSVSTTGNLGPDVLEGKEKGLVYMAASKDGNILSRKLVLTGDRKQNKEQATLSALELLIELLEGEG